MSFPAVTCLCLTMKGRLEFLQRAGMCFFQQTYQRKELLIVCDSENEDPGMDRFLPRLNFSEFDLHQLVVPQGLTIGQKRNLGCEFVQSDLIVNWDDDDFSAPDRLACQVASIEVSRKAVTGFQIMKFTDGASWWQFSLPAGHVFGSSLCFTREWWETHRFSEVNIGEDAAFCERAAMAGQLVQCPDTDLMYATIHSGNTSKKKVTEPGWVALPGFQCGM